MKILKSNLNRTICKCALILAAPLVPTAWAAEPPVPPLPPSGMTHDDRNADVRHAPMHEQSFLGLVTRNADEAVTAQLELPPETGLVVVDVVPDGPAAGVLKVNDLLVRFDDQVLIESRQLGVLVRSHKEGDEVKLTYYRAGKQQTVNVKLAKRMVSEASMRLPHNRNKFFGRTDDGPSSVMFFGEGRPGPGEMRISRIEHKGAVMFFEDGKGRLEIAEKDGKKILTARNEKNDVVFSGPVETPEQRKALPQEVRERLEKMEATDVRMPVPPAPPQPPEAGMGAQSSSMMIFGNGEMDDPMEPSFAGEQAS